MRAPVAKFDVHLTYLVEKENVEAEDGNEAIDAVILDLDSALGDLRCLLPGLEIWLDYSEAEVREYARG